MALACNPKVLIADEPTTNLDLAVNKLRKVTASDFTPMATGLLKAWKSSYTTDWSRFALFLLEAPCILSKHTC
jgi:ABC-type antimicrobial peptide transport system ATPase subunit